jgi:4-cresol dehydrogenase (hydroxylating)
MEHGLSHWNGIGGLYGSRSEVRAAKQRIRAEFQGTAKIIFFGRRELALMNAIGRKLNRIRWVRRLSSLARSCENVLDLLEGIPNTSHISGVDWRQRRPIADATADVRRSGLIWVSPVLPATREDVRKVLDLMSPIFAKFGFDLLVTLSSVTERSLCCVTSINYDKSDVADAARAAKCYEQLMAVLLQNGYVPYRVASVKNLSKEEASHPHLHSEMSL